MILFYNGNFVAKEEVKISPFDHGFLYGDAVYETILVYKRKIYFKKEHWQRLQQSLLVLKISLPSEYSLEYFCSMCETLVEKNDFENARLRITVSRGENHFDFSSCLSPTVIASLSPLSFFSKEHFQNGVPAISVFMERIFPHIKHTNFLSGVVLRQIMQEKNAFEAIYQTPEGFLREGSISNIFAVLPNEKTVWISPRNQVLAGIMQGFVENLLLKKQYSIVEKNFTAQALQQANASLFLCNSLMGVMPVSRLNEKKLPLITLFPPNIYELLDFKI